MIEKLNDWMDSWDVVGEVVFSIVIATIVAIIFAVVATKIVDNYHAPEAGLYCRINDAGDYSHTDCLDRSNAK